jgi:ABC-type glycerol-3-phosphate transport system permease component
LITVLGASGALVLNCLGAYALSKRTLPGMINMVYSCSSFRCLSAAVFVAHYMLIRSIGWL